MQYGRWIITWIKLCAVCNTVLVFSKFKIDCVFGVKFVQTSCGSLLPSKITAANIVYATAAATF